MRYLVRSLSIALLSLPLLFGIVALALAAGSSGALGAPPQQPALVQAAGKGDLGTVNLIISRGADVNQRDNCNDTPLTAAARGGFPDVVQALLKAGARIDYRGICPEPQRSVLCVAAEQGNLETVRLLMERGAPPNGRDERGRTPLMCAASAGNLEAMTFLLRNGADIHAVESTPTSFPPPIDTALMHAARNGRWQAVELLLNEGARVNDKGLADFTALAYAIERSFFGPVHETNPRDYPATLRILLERGAGPNSEVQDQWRSTPLALAVRGDKTRLLPILLAAGANPNSRGAAGETPLMIAVKRGNLDDVRLLVEKGGDASIADREGRSSRQLAHMAGFSDIEHFLQGDGIPTTATIAETPVGITAEKTRVMQQVRLVWEFPLGERPSGGPWLLDNKVLYHTYGGRLVAFSAQTGIKLWEASTDGPTVSSPVLEQNLLYFGTAKHVFAVRLGDGEKVWQYRKSVESSGELVVDGQAVYLNSARNFHAIDRHTGKELWRLRAASAATYTPVLAGSTILLGEADGRLIAVEAQSGRVKWESATSASSALGDELLGEASRMTKSREAQDMFQAMGPRDLLPFAKGVCESLFGGQAEADVVANLAEFLGSDTGAAIAAAAKKVLCPAGTTPEQMAATARKLEMPGEKETLASAPSVHGGLLAFRTRQGLTTGAIQLAELESGRVLVRWPTRASAGSAPAIADAVGYFMDGWELVARAKEGKLWSLDLQFEGAGYDTPIVLFGNRLFAVSDRNTLEIDRATGAILRRIPVGKYIRARARLLRGEICGMGRDGAYMEDLGSASAGRAVHRSDLPNAGFTMACGGDMLFYYEDGDRYPARGLEIVGHQAAGN